jgi:hypothetical protein
MSSSQGVTAGGGVGDAAQDGDGGAAAVLPENDPGGGDEVSESLFLPLSAVLGDPEGRDAGRADGDDGRPAPVGAAVGVGDDDCDPGAGVSD